MKFVIPVLLLFGFHTAISGQPSDSYYEICTYSRDQADMRSLTANPAALPGIREPGIAIVTMRPFLLPELNRYSISGIYPTAPGAFAIQIQSTGGSNYGEIMTGFAYGRKLNAGIDAGIRFNYYNIRAAGYGRSGAIGFAAGTIIQLTSALRGGISASNPVGGRFGKNKEEKLPSVYSFGLGYDASELCFIGFEIIKYEDIPVNVNAGIQYTLHKRCYVRTGISTATGSFWGGAGLILKQYRLDIACSYHPQLGFTPGLGLLFNFKKKPA